MVCGCRRTAPALPVSEKGDVLSVAARFAVVVMRVPGSQHMGDYVNGNAAKILGWLIAALMAAQAIALATGGISTWPIRLELGHPTSPAAPRARPDRLARPGSADGHPCIGLLSGRTVAQDYVVAWLPIRLPTANVTPTATPPRTSWRRAERSSGWPVIRPTAIPPTTSAAAEIPSVAARSGRPAR